MSDVGQIEDEKRWRIKKEKRSQSKIDANVSNKNNAHLLS